MDNSFHVFAGLLENQDLYIGLGGFVNAFLGNAIPNL
jgi:hypothetical protein